MAKNNLKNPKKGKAPAPKAQGEAEPSQATVEAKVVEYLETELVEFEDEDEPKTHSTSEWNRVLSSRRKCWTLASNIAKRNVAQEEEITRLRAKNEALKHDRASLEARLKEEISNLKYEQTRNHDPEIPAVVHSTCGYCLSQFGTLGELEQHLLAVHGVPANVSVADDKAGSSKARELHRLKRDLKNAAETETTKTLREIFDEKTRNLAQGRMLTFRDVEPVMRKRKANSDLSDEAEPSVEDDDWDSGASAPPLPLEQAASAASAPSTIQVNSFGLDFAFISTHYCNIFHYKM